MRCMCREISEKDVLKFENEGNKRDQTKKMELVEKTGTNLL